VTSPTQRSLAHLRKTCQAVQVVERWCAFSRRRVDLFGVVDILALRGEETIAVQTTSWANTSARVRKIAESEHIGTMRNAGWRIVVHGWRKNGHRWEMKEIDVS